MIHLKLYEEVYPPSTSSDNKKDKKKKKKCGACNGKGYITPDRIHSVDCDNCNGTGII